MPNNRAIKFKQYCPDCKKQTMHQKFAASIMFDEIMCMKCGLFKRVRNDNWVIR